jgi:hypothetical protein
VTYGNVAMKDAYLVIDARSEQPRTMSEDEKVTDMLLTDRAGVVVR